MSFLLQQQQQIADHIPPSGLFAFWDMNDGSGQYAGVVHGEHHIGRLQLGTTPTTDINDPTWQPGCLLFSVDDACIVDSYLRSRSNWSIYICAQYSAYGAVLGLADPTSDTKFFHVYVSSGKLYAQFYDNGGVINRVTTGIDFLNNRYESFVLKKNGDTLTIKTFRTNVEYSVSTAGISDYLITIGVGFLPRLSRDSFIFSMKACAGLAYARTTTSEEDTMIYRYLSAYKSRQGININD